MFFAMNMPALFGTLIVIYVIGCHFLLCLEFGGNKLAFFLSIDSM